MRKCKLILIEVKNCVGEEELKNLIKGWKNCKWIGEVEGTYLSIKSEK